MMRQVVLVAMVGLALCLVGCEDGDDDSPSVDVTGVWNGEFSSGLRMTMNLTQSGSSVHGLGSDTDRDAWTFSGSVSGNTLTGTALTSSGPAGAVSATVSGNQMTGTWTQGGDSGTFVAIR